MPLHRCSGRRDRRRASSGTPWLPVNPDARDFNAATEEADPNSVLSFYSRLIALRKRVPALVYGAWRDVDPDHPTVFGYTRTLPDAACLVLMNFGREPVAYRLPAGVVAGDILLSSEAGSAPTTDASVVHLAGWQSLVLSAVWGSRTRKPCSTRDDRRIARRSTTAARVEDLRKTPWAAGRAPWEAPRSRGPDSNSGAPNSVTTFCSLT